MEVHAEHITRGASLPSWECGLKYRFGIIYKTSSVVAPLVGVWIEIVQDADSGVDTTSLPSWECGLKFVSLEERDKKKPSLPSWECGLKYDSGVLPPSVKRRSPRGSVD